MGLKGWHRPLPCDTQAPVEHFSAFSYPTAQLGSARILYRHRLTAHSSEGTETWGNLPLGDLFSLDLVCSLGLAGLSCPGPGLPHVVGAPWGLLGTGLLSNRSLLSGPQRARRPEGPAPCPVEDTGNAALSGGRLAQKAVPFQGRRQGWSPPERGTAELLGVSTPDLTCSLRPVR